MRRKDQQMDKNNLYRNISSTAKDLEQLYEYQVINLTTLAKRLAANHEDIIDTNQDALACQVHFTKSNGGVTETKRFRLADFETEDELSVALTEWVTTK